MRGKRNYYGFFYRQSSGFDGCFVEFQIYLLGNVFVLYVDVFNGVKENGFFLGIEKALRK